MTIGIYCIENLINGKKYIGRAVNIKKRWNKHKSYLRNNVHFNSHLQNAWNKYGEDKFAFTIIEECDESILSNREIFYITIFDSKNNGYNLTDGGEGINGFKFSEERLKKMSEIMIGKHPSEETKRKISEALKGKIVSKETREKLAKASTGKIFSEETRQKLSQIGKKKKNWVNRKVRNANDS